jgi:membrane-bound serine protease (ClpP class)
MQLTDGHPDARGKATSSFAAVRRVCAALLVVLAGCFLVAGPPASGQVEVGGAILLVDVKGAIGFVSSAQISKAVQRAEADKASAVIVRMDTPGGLLTSTREMIQTILGSRVPIIMYVAPSGARAASAGTYLLYAAHVAAMAPGTHLGAATPISLAPPAMPGQQPTKPSQGSDEKKDADPAGAAERKSLNDAIAYIRSLAQLRDRNADWAEKAVREAATLTAMEAAKERVIDVVASDIEGLLSSVNGKVVTTAAGEVRLETRGREVVAIETDWKMRLMSAIADPNIAIILLMIGIYGIIFEFWSPGAIVPGVVGGISLIVALTALSVLPVNFAGLALLLFGIGLMVAEAFSPGFGIAGLGGIVAFAIGALFLFDPSESDVPIAVSWQLIAGLAVLSAGFFAGVLGFALKARQRPVATGAEQLIGMNGEVVSWSGSEGRVRVHGEIWSARSEQVITAGHKVRVVGRTGLQLSVEPST